MIRLTAILMLLATQAPAAEVVGTAVLGSKRVELLNDNTWRYADVSDDSEAGCVPINNRLGFCGSILNWRPIDTSGTEFLRQFRHNDRIYAGIIHEELGAADGMDAEFMRNVIIENAALGSGVNPAEIPIHGVEETEVDGQPAETIIFGANFSGLDVVFQNTLVNAENFNLQLVVWSIGAEVSDEAKKMKANFLSSVRITPGDAQ